jgi:hypothetical protein
VAEVARCEAALAEARAAIGTTRASTRRRALPPEQRARVVALRAALAEARGQARDARRALAADPTVRAALDAIQAVHRDRAKAAYRTSGCYWGQRALADQAMDAARRAIEPPRFRRWTGEGAVGLQIIGGLSVADLADDTRVQLDLVAQPVPGRAGKPRQRVRLRIGSTETRDPIWAEWPVILHRPLPPDAQIVWVRVVRRREASRDVWSLHLTLQLPAPTRAATSGTGPVAVDLGWRRTPETLRAGGWHDGVTGEDILLPADVPARLRKADDIRSLRDGQLNEIRAALLVWREAVETLPPAHAEALRWLPQWRSPARFAALARWWRDQRLAGDAAIVEALEAWRRRDKHLWLYETGLRSGALAHRRDAYRVLAADLARRYDTLVIERLDLRALATVPVPESERESHPRARAQRHATAPSELRTALVQAFRSRGGQVVTVPASGPAETLLATWRERPGDVEIPAIARVSKYGRIRAELAAKAARAAEEAAALAEDRGRV